MNRNYALCCALLLLALLGSLAPARAQSGPATLVKDLDPAPYQPGFSMGDTALVVGSRLFFTATDDSHGAELWVSDGTPAGSHLVKDIAPGDQGAEPMLFVSFNGRLFFIANDGTHGPEPWLSDGTEAGTYLVKDIAPGRAYGVPDTSSAPVVFANKVYFAAYDPVHGNGLWASDGSEAGTSLVKDTLPESASRDWGLPYSLIVAGPTLYFLAASQTSGGLWRSDGTPAGTSLVRPRGGLLSVIGPWLYLRDGYGLSASDGTDAGTVAVLATNTVSPLADLGGRAFFLENGSGYYAPNTGRLWVSDGGPASLVKSLGQIVRSDPIVVGAKIYFLSEAAGGARTLWVSDGTTAGTLPIAQLPAGATIGGPVSAGSKTLFLVADGSQIALWETDGSAAGTTQISALGGSQVGAGSVQTMRSFGGRMLAALCADQVGCEYWASDGTAAGSQRLGGLVAHDPPPLINLMGGLALLRSCDSAGVCGLLRSDGTASGTSTLIGGQPLAPAGMKPLGIQIGERSFFTFGEWSFFAQGMTYTGSDNQLWVSDGTSAGTRLLHQGSSDGPLRSFARAGSLLFFIELPGSALWRTDGTPAGTVKLATLSGLIKPPAAIGGSVYFVDQEAGYSYWLWRSDGTPAGTAKVKLLKSGIWYGLPTLKTFGDKLLYAMDGALYISDGTTAADVKLADLGWADPFELSDAAVVNGRLLFWLCMINDRLCGLWSSDGTPAGTQKLGDIGDIDNIYQQRAGGRLFFVGSHPGGRSLWASDGTPAGTVQLTQISPWQMTALGDRLLFVMDDGVHGYELWVSDGTPAGTGLLKDIWPGADGQDIQGLGLVAVDDHVYFSASDPAHGRELWLSDGTPAGTRLAADIWPGPLGSSPTDLAGVANGQLYFSAASPGHGAELWMHDRGGARQVQEIAAGALSANPAGLDIALRRLYFTANDGASGPALWSLPLESQPYRTRTLGVSASIEAEDYDLGGEGLAYHDADPFNHRNVYRPDEAVDTEANGPGNYLLGWAQPGEWVSYSFDVTAARDYRLRFAVASQGAGGTFHLELDGQAVAGALTVPDTGGWTSWRGLDGPALSLTPGRHTLRVVFDTAGASGYVANLDRIILDGSSDDLSLPLVMR